MFWRVWLAVLCCTSSAAAEQHALPSSMKAVFPTHFVGTNYSELACGSKSLPHIKDDQVLIAVNTSSVNPCDLDMMKGRAEADLAITLRKTLGFDVAGVVVQVGSKCQRIKLGDEVWTDLGELGLTEGIAEMGAFAEYAVADESQVGLKPSNLDFIEAGVVPLVGLTNYQAFLKAGAPWDIASNKTVVITSGQGGTGHLAIQMAKAMGAGFIISVASTPNLEWVKSLGADVVVDYTKQSVWDVLEEDSVDVVYDNFGAKGSADASMKVLRAGGTLVMIQGKLALKAKKNVKQYKILCKVDGHEQLDQLAKMAEDGQMKVKVQQGFPLDDIGDAYNTIASGKVVGKLAVRVA